MNTRSVGNRYENTAAAYLESIGYQILERNFRIRSGEIDIIAYDPVGSRTDRTEPEIVFCEVKFRRTDACGEAAAHVDRRKQEKIARTASYYLLSSARCNAFCRFDVVAIDGTGQITHYKNAFSAA